VTGGSRGKQPLQRASAPKALAPAHATSSCLPPACPAARHGEAAPGGWPHGCTPGRGLTARARPVSLRGISAGRQLSGCGRARTQHRAGEGAREGARLLPSKAQAAPIFPAALRSPPPHRAEPALRPVPLQTAPETV